MLQISCTFPNELRLTGDLDLVSDGDLNGALAPLEGPIRLDLSGLDFMDSTGLRVVAQRLTIDHVCLVRPSARVMRVVDLCGLRDVPGLTIEEA